VKTLILGGIRSGKSRLAESLAAGGGLPVTYVATATGDDDEMRARIMAHRRHRPTDWTVVEEPLSLANALGSLAQAGTCVIVDCLTLWLTNLLLARDDRLLRRERDSLLELLPNLSGTLILVSNETNLGVVPADSLSRRFCDEAGRLHQALAQRCERVVFTTAGLPHVLKGAPL
jgi:adenosylcobinamide kinase/adenosylcobinamide-phosphate guanylyltransferase